MEYDLTDFTVLPLLRTIFFALAPLIFLLYKTRKDPRIVKLLSDFNGPPSLPVLGTVHTILNYGGPAEIFSYFFYKSIHLYGRLFREWHFNRPHIIIASAKDAGKVLHAVQHSTKSKTYEFSHPLMGMGVGTINDINMWMAHRKILTPSFNFNSLRGFLHIFNKNAKILSDKLKLISAGGKEFNIFNPISLCTLDIINETSMGVKINAQLEENAPYVTAAKNMSVYIMLRYSSPLLWVPLFYRFSSLKRNVDKAMKIINDFSGPVIAQRRQYLQSIKESGDESSTKGAMEDEIGLKKKKVVFLDVILTAEKDGKPIYNDSDILDEVNTIMVAGSDTVSTAVGWTLFLMGTYPEVQEKVVEELIQVFGDTGREPTMSDLSELNYLERCIKETLRLYPSLPAYERAIKEDIQLDCGRVIPAGCEVSILAYSIHRDPEHFPEPKKFDPDRFLPENTKKRHPYAYLPFSAGPRNCLGQKYALFEVKSLLSTILRRFRVETPLPQNEVILEVGVILQTQNGGKVKFFERESLPNLQVFA